VPKRDAPFGEIIGRHFNGDTVTRQDPDAVPFHASGSVRKCFVAVIKPHPEARIGQKLNYRPFHLDDALFAHPVSSRAGADRQMPPVTPA
jgi:hypothetical protein